MNIILQTEAPLETFSGTSGISFNRSSTPSRLVSTDISTLFYITGLASPLWARPLKTQSCIWSQVPRTLSESTDLLKGHGKKMILGSRWKLLSLILQQTIFLRFPSHYSYCQSLSSETTASTVTISTAVSSKYSHSNLQTILLASAVFYSLNKIK